MSESFSFRFHETPAEKFLRQFEESELTLEEVDRILRSIEELLAKVIETGGDLDPQALALLRQQLQSLLVQLDLNDLMDLPVVYSFLSNKSTERITPDWYPPLWKFEDIIERLLRDNLVQRDLVPQNAKASDLAQNAQVDKDLMGRGGISLSEYLYNLGIFMTNAYAYKLMVPDSDAIKIRDDWKVENGRHRSFVLRIIGTENVEKIGMDQWVKVEVERPYQALASARNMLWGKL